MSPAQSLARIREQTAKMRAIVASRDLTASVPQSAWTVSEHLDHTIKVASSTIQVLLKPELPTLPYKMNLMGRLVLLCGWIPRGRGKAPEKLTGAHATREDLDARLTQLDAIVDRASAEPPRSDAPVLRHPAFGGLSWEQSLAFVAIHTHHHLKIIRAA
ncbi:MAG TPA: DinB family protein [Thermoanaerobaculia bacterium]|nr:DinB family protein [Thermoanaerobaculia bacterium]